MQELYEVRGRTINGRTVTIAAGIIGHDEAVNDALAIDMDGWDDIWVIPMKKIADAPELPWSVTWASGRVYLSEPSGKIVAMLTGKRALKVATLQMLKEKGLVT